MAKKKAPKPKTGIPKAKTTAPQMTPKKTKIPKFTPC